MAAGEGIFSATEATLDPSGPEEWEEFRALAHQILDDALDYQRDLRSRPVWTPMPEEAKAALRVPTPGTGVGTRKAYEEFVQWILPYNYGNVHPRFWGWVNGQGTPLAAIAEMLAATMNPNCWGGEHAASYVEAEVLRWLRSSLALPTSGSGLLVSGGSLANLIALAAAREAKAGTDVARRGLCGTRLPILYMSTEGHNSLDKAAAFLGLGFDAVRRIPVTSDFQIDLEMLRAAVEADYRSGHRPFCVVATAGTVNTGAIDPLSELADFCEEHDLWLHVDGAFGALAALVPGLRPLVNGLEKADSVAFDLHKWLYQPIGIGCVLVRDSEAHARPFSPPADYLQTFERGIAAGEQFYATYGPELTRPFRALKAWLCMRAYGFDRYAQQIQQNVHQARVLQARIEEEAELELLAPVPLNIVCFRYRSTAALRGQDLDALNRELLMRLWESGVAAPSGTMIRGAFALRCAFTNHRTRLEDVDLLLAKVLELGRRLSGDPAYTGHERRG